MVGHCTLVLSVSQDKKGLRPQHYHAIRGDHTARAELKVNLFERVRSIDIGQRVQTRKKSMEMKARLRAEGEPYDKQEA